jgi:uncharacterized membrane protein YqjE
MALQLLLALVLPMALLVGLTVLIASGRLSLNQTAVWFLARQNRIWMSGVVVLTAAAAIYASRG